MRSWEEKLSEYRNLISDIEIFLSQDFKNVTLKELITVLTMSSGPLRGPYMEKWFVDNKFYSSKVSSKEGRGDLTNGKVYDELKVRFLRNSDIDKGKLHSAGQIRLWEKVDNYLFITVNIDTLEAVIYYIPKVEYKKLVLDRVVRFSSSHIKGNSLLLKENPSLVDELEISSELNSNDFDWSSYQITLEELKKKLSF